MHCWCNICHGTQSTDNSRICHCLLFHEHGKENFMQRFHLSRKLLRYTHAWTKLHNKVMSWISGAYECHYAWPLPEANATTVRDLAVLSVSSLPLSVMVCSRAFIGVELVHRTWICFRTCANLKYVRSFKFSVCGHEQTYIHTYTRIKQCSHASVGLAQARPNDGEIYMYTVTVFRMLSFLQGSWTYRIPLIKHRSYFFFFHCSVLEWHFYFIKKPTDINDGWIKYIIRYSDNC